MFTHHYESSTSVATTAPTLFAFLDDHARLSGHMRESSWMMAGGRMTVDVDAQQGRAVGSRIRLQGSVLGLRLFVDEIVTEYEPPQRKSWETTDDVVLLVIGPYRMGFEITPDGARSRLRVFINYTLPDRGIWKLLAPVLGPWYARWCTKRMVSDALQAFPGDRSGFAAVYVDPGVR